MTAPILARDRVCAGYAQSTVLFDLSLEIEMGECIGLLGRNGEGKTTTIRAVMGLTPAPARRIGWKTTDIKPKVMKQVAMRLGSATRAS